MARALPGQGDPRGPVCRSFQGLRGPGTISKPQRLREGRSANTWGLIKYSKLLPALGLKGEAGLKSESRSHPGEKGVTSRADRLGGPCGKAKRGFCKGGGGASVPVRFREPLRQRRPERRTGGGGASAGASVPIRTAPSRCRRRGLCASSPRLSPLLLHT